MPLICDSQREHHAAARAAHRLVPGEHLHRRGEQRRRPRLGLRSHRVRVYVMSSRHHVARMFMMYHITRVSHKRISTSSLCARFLLNCSDLCTAFGASVLPMFDREPISSLLTKGRRSKASKAKQLATWATREIRKLKNQSSW